MELIKRALKQLWKGLLPVRLFPSYNFCIGDLDLLPAVGTDPFCILLDISLTFLCSCRVLQIHPFSGHGYVNAAVDMIS